MKGGDLDLLSLNWTVVQSMLFVLCFKRLEIGSLEMISPWKLEGHSSIEIWFLSSTNQLFFALCAVRRER